MLTVATQRPVILDKVKLAGYTTFETGDYNVNIIGERRLPGTLDKFDDKLHVVYRAGGAWYWHEYACTTDPGKYYTDKPMNPKGTGRLAKGQYRRSFKLSTFKGDPALIQILEVVMERSSGLDRGYFGVAIHKADGNPKQIGRWSAGCQVIQLERDWEEFITVIQESSKRYSVVFTYTLLETQSG